jgi:CheY-like chemotaxis protein
MHKAGVPPKPAPGLLRFLVVGDEVGTMEEVSTYLRRGGYLVTVAREGTSALEALEPPPTLAIVDGHLPDMKAVDLIGPLQAAVPGIPVILIIAWPNPLLYAETMERGAAACLSRPFSPWSFGFILQQILRSTWMPGTRPWHARRALRASVEIPTIVHRYDNDEPLLGHLRDLSHTGTMAVVPGRIGGGQPVVMEFGPPDHYVRLEGTVVWSREDALHPGIYLHGLEFAEPRPLDFAYEIARRLAPFPKGAGSERSVGVSGHSLPGRADD